MSKLNDYEMKRLKHDIGLFGLSSIKWRKLPESLKSPYYVYPNDFCTVLLNNFQNTNAYYPMFEDASSYLCYDETGIELISAIKQGAKKITIYTPNGLIRRAIELHIAAIKSLSFTEYIKFYKGIINNTFNEELYNKVFNELSLADKTFWQHISMYNTFNNSFFLSLKNERVSDNNHLLITDVHDYNLIRSKIKKVEIVFKDQNIINSVINEYPKEKYDAISLGMLYTSYNNGYQISNKKALAYCDFLLNLSKKYCMSSSQCVFAYIPNFNNRVKQDIERNIEEKSFSIKRIPEIEVYPNCTATIKGIKTTSLSAYLLIDSLNIKRFDINYYNYLKYIITTYIPTYSYGDDVKEDMVLSLVKK